MNANITMKDIAEKLGVSVVTVSKALNDKEGVGEELRARIKETAADLGYRFNLMAKSMKEGMSYNIGVIVAERFTGPGQSFYMQFYQHIAQVLEEYEYSGILHVLSQEDEGSLALPRIYNEKKVDGFIILGQMSKEYVDMFHNTGSPFVLLDFYTDQNVDCVVTDNFFATYEMTNYLIREGHRDIAFVGNIHSTSSIQDRFLGYFKSLLEHGLELKADYILNDRDHNGAYVEIALPQSMPTAFVCNCDQVAFNLVNLLRKKGITIPGECSVVGFDNDIFATISEPNLTTVEVNVREMSKAAVKMVIKKFKSGSRQYGRVLVKGELVLRDSVAPARR